MTGRLPLRRDGNNRPGGVRSKRACVSSDESIRNKIEVKNHQIKSKCHYPLGLLIDAMLGLGE